MIQATINGRSVSVAEGTTILDAARVAGVHIPTLCYYPRLPAHAVCRLCLVNVQGEKTPLPACRTSVQNGAVIETDRTELIEFRKTDAQWLLARHPNECIRCEVNGQCAFQTFVYEYQLEDQWEKIPRGSPSHPEHSLCDHTSPSIWRDLDKCVECGLCADACGEPGQQQFIIGFAEHSGGKIPVTVFDKPLSQTDCISCGQCTLVCPTGALIETPHWHSVLHTLDAHRRISAVQVAPATRVAIGEEFGMPPGTISTGRMINALRALGFDYVFDTNFAADLTIMEEAHEFIQRVSENTKLPLFTSCCPGWVNWVELHRPDILPHLSTTKSPQQMHGALTKRTAFAKTLGSDFSEGREEPYVVSIMPCTAKKDESARPGVSGDIDKVLTTRELARMIRARGIAFHALDESGSFDNPLGESTGAAQIFGASGGVMEAVLRTASHLLNKNNDLPLEWHPLRGVNQRIKTADVHGLGKIAVCNGIAAAQQLLSNDDWRHEFVAIEVMACVGGCLGGGGEPKSLDPDILQKRMEAIYAIDQNAPKRRSYENTDVIKLYKQQLEHPNSDIAHRLLHTQYAPRHSTRLLLMRFLDYVDRRDGLAAAQLCHPQALWTTASPYGEIKGREKIRDFIHETLPPRQYGPQYQRHRMAHPSQADDFVVLAPNDESCRFHIETTTLTEAGTQTTVIRSLVREVLE